MDNLYYDEEARCIHLCNGRGDVLTIHYPVCENSKKIFAGMPVRFWRWTFHMNFSELGDFLEYWGNECAHLSFHIYDNIEVRLGRADDMDFSGVKFIVRGGGLESRLSFMIDSSWDRMHGIEAVDITKISDEYLLLIYDFCCYTKGKLNNNIYPEKLSSKYYRHSLMYFSFLGKIKGEIKVSDSLVIERLRGLGKID
jgi:hypothetical protein